MLLAIDLHKGLVDEEAPLTPVSTIQTFGVFAHKPDAPEPDGFVADGDPSLSK
jgi:hypothetical protein